MLRHTFGAVARPDARVLILGSMPGAASLRAGEYYAHPQNQFWLVMRELLGAGRELPYDKRLMRLQSAKVALWDVVGECVRPGSMDGDIKRSSVKPNDFVALFARCPKLEMIAFNGQTAAALFRQQVDAPPHLRLVQLPSTSPAHARMDLNEKISRWRAGLALTQAGGA